MRRASSQGLEQPLSPQEDEQIGSRAFHGPDGHGDALLKRANFTWALGAATWPHMLARALVTEQIYRTSCILSGHPYHHG